MEQIICRTELTEKIYRKYMYYHVFRRDKGWLKHLIMCAVILIFGLMNLYTNSPVLAVIFITLALYLFVSRYLRFFISIGRITEQFGLGAEPNYFYTLTLSDSVIHVENGKETADYPWDRVCLACIFPDIIYLYMNPQTALLLPTGCLTSASGTDSAAANAELAGLIEAHVPSDKLRRYL
ncbi:MAG: YcxB family protein [Eubacteriales bacterium]|nr:YcxB family protein [Eubacteriales bacterium]